MIPDTIHLIWLGSLPRDTHLENIKKWRELNPLHDVKLWIDSSWLDDQQLTSLLKFAKKYRVKVRETTQLITRHKRYKILSQWLENTFKLAKDKKHVQNFCFHSDILRFALLDYYGGWYFDTDLEPTQPLPYNKQGFFVDVGWKNNNKFDYLNPDAIASEPGSPFIKRALHYIDTIYQHIEAKNLIYALTHDCKTSVRNQAIMYSSGFIAMAACSRLRFANNEFYIQFGEALLANPKHCKTILIPDCYTRHSEKTYLYDADGKPLEGLEESGTSKDTELDPCVKEMAIMLDRILDTIPLATILKPAKSTKPVKTSDLMPAFQKMGVKERNSWDRKEYPPKTERPGGK